MGRLRIVRVYEGMDDNPPGTLPFGDDMGQLDERWHDGVVVVLGNEGSYEYTTVFNNGTPTFCCGDGTFTPRCEDWSDVRVEVLQDDK